MNIYDVPELNDMDLRSLAAAFITEYSVRFGPDRLERWILNLTDDQSWLDSVQKVVLERLEKGVASATETD